MPPSASVREPGPWRGEDHAHAYLPGAALPGLPVVERGTDTAGATLGAGSGQVVGIGRTDRVIVCTTPSIAATYRIFDRSGDQPGIIVEKLSTSTS